MPIVFAFGTLKRGFPLHHWLDGALPHGPARTVHPHPLVIAGPRFAPMMFPEKNRGLHVFGEVYSVDEVQLARLDQIESVGKPGNMRVPLCVMNLEAREIIEAQAYVKSREIAEPIHSRYLSEYKLDPRFVSP